MEPGSPLSMGNVSCCKFKNLEEVALFYSGTYDFSFLDFALYNDSLSVKLGFYTITKDQCILIICLVSFTQHTKLLTELGAIVKEGKLCSPQVWACCQGLLAQTF